MDEKKDVATDETTVDETKTDEIVDVTEDSNQEVEEVETVEETQTEEAKDTTDYKSLYEEEQARREKAETATQKYKEKLKDTKSPETEVKTDEKSEGLTEDSMRRIVREERQSEVVKEKITTLSDNVDEQKLIDYHYNNTIKQSGDVDKDLQRAKIIANESKLLGREQEIAKINESKETKTQTTTSFGREKNHPMPKLSVEDRKMLNGYKYNSTKGIFFKDGAKFAMKLENGVLVQTENN